MNTIEQNFLDYLEEIYDVNANLDFWEDSEAQSLEVNAPGLFVTIELLASCQHSTEIGGEPDEYLAVQSNKNVCITEIAAWEDEAKFYPVSEKFKNLIENKINDLLYE